MKNMRKTRVALKARKHARTRKNRKSQKGGDHVEQLEALLRGYADLPEVMNYLKTIEHPCVHGCFPNAGPEPGMYNVLIEGEPHDDASTGPVLFLRFYHDGVAFTRATIDMWETDSKTLTDEYGCERLRIGPIHNSIMKAIVNVLDVTSC